ncbi:unnamed protein product, partial [Choristocarpus tenellus]
MKPNSIYVNDKAVLQVIPYTPRTMLWRLDVVPFALLYALVYTQASSWTGDGVAIWSRVWGREKLALLLALPMVILAQLLVFLFTRWSVRFKCFVAYRRVTSVDHATVVRVVPAPHCGSEELVQLQRRTPDAERSELERLKMGRESTSGAIEAAGQRFALPEVWFIFQQTKFVHGDMEAMGGGGEKGFRRLDYPVQGSFRAYLASEGTKNIGALARARERWGENILDIPMPAFSELFVEHALAPFFMFQVLCVTLWSLDEYWIYSFFTLLMLILFEAMLCKQRQRSLELLRSMRREPTLVYARRAGRWTRVSSETICPGEVVSLVAHPPTVEAALREAKMRASRAFGRMHSGGGGIRGGGKGLGA